jgi:2'-5' RNA ligase
MNLTRTSPRNEQDTADVKPVSYFVTSFLPMDAAQELVRLGAALPPQVVRNSIPRIHVTWRSFDGLPHGRFLPLKRALREVAAAHSPFQVRVRGGGSFDAGAIWVRLVSPQALALQADVDAALTRVGCPPASHPFIPHVTLGHGPAGTSAPVWLSDIDLETYISEIFLTTTGQTEYRVAVRLPLGEAGAEEGS